MGYTTFFEGAFQLNQPLTPEQKAYLKAFSETRRMRYNSKAEAYEDPIRQAVGLPFGPGGAFFVGKERPHCDPAFDFSKEKFHYQGFLCDDGFNAPPPDQPGLHCDWVPNEEGTAIIWNGAEKFHSYNEWLGYLIVHFLQPWGYVLNGEMVFKGEDAIDQGTLSVADNVIKQLWSYEDCALSDDDDSYYDDDDSSDDDSSDDEKPSVDDRKPSA
jgi:hypothetical protein